jgi:hypothetical protein
MGAANLSIYSATKAAVRYSWYVTAWDASRRKSQEEDDG